jgi:hypothetical protein
MISSQLQILNNYILLRTNIDIEPSRYYFIFSILENHLVSKAVRILQNIPENRKFVAPKKMFAPVELAYIRSNGVINTRIPEVNFGSILELYKKDVLKNPGVRLLREEKMEQLIPALYYAQRTQGMVPGLVHYLNYETLQLGFQRQ